MRKEEERHSAPSSTSELASERVGTGQPCWRRRWCPGWRRARANPSHDTPCYCLFLTSTGFSGTLFFSFFLRTAISLVWQEIEQRWALGEVRAIMGKNQEGVFWKVGMFRAWCRCRLHSWGHVQNSMCSSEQFLLFTTCTSDLSESRKKEKERKKTSSLIWLHSSQVYVIYFFMVQFIPWCQKHAVYILCSFYSLFIFFSVKIFSETKFKRPFMTLILSGLILCLRGNLYFLKLGLHESKHRVKLVLLLQKMHVSCAFVFLFVLWKETILLCMHSPNLHWILPRIHEFRKI